MARPESTQKGRLPPPYTTQKAPDHTLAHHSKGARRSTRRPFARRADPPPNAVRPVSNLRVAGPTDGAHDRAADDVLGLFPADDF